MVNSIVRQSGGLVRTSSEPGEGRTVKIYLPLVDETEPPTAHGETASHGSETVLIVEDEDGVRELLGRILTDAGYNVLEGRDGRDALVAASQYGSPIHLLVTDVVMPGMSDGKLAVELVGRRPQIEVLYISGYAESELRSRGVRSAENSFQNKPFTRDELLNKVRGLLDKRLV